MQDYLTLEDPTQIYNMASIDMAFTVAYNLTRDFSMRTFNLTEDQAITAITTVMDFAVTQVVDGKPTPAWLSGQWCYTLTMALSCVCHRTMDEVHAAQGLCCTLLMINR